jgi:mono/diheme cytochrome c family protein
MHAHRSVSLLTSAIFLTSGYAAEKSASAKRAHPKSSDGPGITVNPNPHERGDAAAGRNVFRFETFGNEGFWTDAARLPKGMADAKLTPKQALEAGLQVDIEAIPAQMRDAMAKELKTDMSPANAPMLNDPSITMKLVEANAVAGVVAVDSNGDGKIEIAPAGPDKVGISCAICHTVTDKSVFELPGAGSIGKRIDGLAATTLNVGKLLAVAANSRAFYPNAHVDLSPAPTASRGKGKPLNAESTEAEFDAFFSDPELYPVGTFDETQDGNGNPVINTALFRQDLAAPYGTAGEFSKLDDISNGSFTTNLDPTTLVTPEGRAFLKMKAGAAGEKLADEYAKILKDTGVTGYPFVKAKMQGKPGELATIVGRRVDNQKLLDMNAYLDELPAPRGATMDVNIVARGRKVFESNCTSCHNSDQSKFVPPTLVELKKMWPDYQPKLIAKRPPLSPILNSPGMFDDKMIIVDASDRGKNRGVALPLLLDLARRTVFLHDASITGGLEELLDPKRGKGEPHSFYIDDEAQRADLIGFLQSLDTDKIVTARSASSDSAGR